MYLYPTKLWIALDIQLISYPPGQGHKHYHLSLMWALVEFSVPLQVLNCVYDNVLVTPWNGYSFSWVDLTQNHKIIFMLRTLCEENSSLMVPQCFEWPYTWNLFPLSDTLQSLATRKQLFKVTNSENSVQTVMEDTPSLIILISSEQCLLTTKLQNVVLNKVINIFWKNHKI